MTKVSEDYIASFFRIHNSLRHTSKDSGLPTDRRL